MKTGAITQLQPVPAYAGNALTVLIYQPLRSCGLNALTEDAQTMPFEPVATQAYRTLERMIVTLELAPAAILTEAVLIERVGFGRTPVREALQRLAWEGLIDIRPRAGLAIAPLHASDWLRVLEARRGLEIVLARSAARFVRKESAAEFQRAALLMHNAVLAANVAAFLEADKALDEVVARVADNPFAARMAGPLQTHCRRFWFRYKGETGLAESAELHVALSRAIIDGDENGAGLAAEHLMAMLRLHAEIADGR